MSAPFPNVLCERVLALRAFIIAGFWRLIALVEPQSELNSNALGYSECASGFCSNFE
jgi:hypothetical protein